MKNDSREFPVGFSGESFSFLVGFEMTWNIFVLAFYSWNKARAIVRSNGVVIFMFSRFDKTMATWKPAASTTEASSVKVSV